MQVKQLSTQRCPPCQTMRQMFNEIDVEGFDYEYVDIQENGERGRMVKEGTPVFKSSVPQFYIDGEPFQGGTYEAMELFHKTIAELKEKELEADENRQD